MSKVQLADCGYTMRRVAGSGELGSSIHVQSILRIQRHFQRSLRLHVTQLR
jgi:hypothetical protein